MEDIFPILAVFGTPVLIIIVVCLFRLMKAHMRHKEVLAAIEKGIALPEPPPSSPRWITNVAIGAAFIAFSPAFVLIGIGAAQQVGGPESTIVFGGTAFPSLIFLSLGLFFLIRGLLVRKYGTPPR
jgi:hypothetical protein